MKKSWLELKRGRPGHRFQDRYARRQQSARGAVARCAFVCTGVVIALLGIVFLPLPGPGMIIIALGALLMADGSRTAAKALDALELRARRVYSTLRSSRQPLRRSGSR